MLTAKGAATRARIVETAADLVLSRGVGGTSLDDIRAGTGTSKSQLFHYFPEGKTELVGAIADFQFERVIEAQRPWIDELGSLEAWEGWRDAVLAHYRGHLACPITAMSAEAGVDVRPHMDRWYAYLRAGAPDEHTALAVFAALQGGLALMKSAHSIQPLEAALDGALTVLRAARPSP